MCLTNKMKLIKKFKNIRRTVKNKLTSKEINKEIKQTRKSRFKTTK